MPSWARNSKVWEDVIEAKGLLTAIGVPTSDQESDREIGRQRGKVRKDFTRIKNRIKSFLLKYGIDEPDGLGNWSGKAFRKRQNPLPFSKVERARVRGFPIAIQTEITHMFFVITESSISACHPSGKMLHSSLPSPQRGRRGKNTPKPSPLFQRGG